MSHPDYKDLGEPEDNVIEECAELIHAIMKAKKFGWFTRHPDKPKGCNLSDIVYEMGDVLDAMRPLYLKLITLTSERERGTTENFS